MKNQTPVYWDSSAILSVLFSDNHSEEAVAWAKKEELHLISSLALAETHAVIRRIWRERLLTDVLIEAALEVLATGPWRQLKLIPDKHLMQLLAKKWPLKGADLWHLAAAKTLQRELSELSLLTFDNKLLAAATGENLEA